MYIGRNFPPADVEGVSCPFVIVRCAGLTQRSSIKKKTLNPGWYETITLDVTLPAFDKDVNLKKSVFFVFKFQIILRCLLTFLQV